MKRELTLFEILAYKYGLEGKYFERAEGIISAKKRELGRELNEDEAALVLAEEGLGDMRGSIIRQASNGAKKFRQEALSCKDTEQIEKMNLFRRIILFGIKREREGD
ncbi:MAG TPA: hypothetical protein VI819_03020 [Patescibacteria group bacterium]|nr:hypothetical protein [Patescibacteria group bacterium]